MKNCLIMTLSLFLFFTGTASSKVYGLNVGIDNYKNEIKLKGAVNDARDIYNALTHIKAEEVILLLNEKATYDAIKRNWKKLIKRTRPGDIVIFSYAGHGGQEPERVPNSEEDHMDEAFILGGFSKEGPGTGQRLLDNEINQWFSKAKEKKISIIFVADACHSGTMTRSVDRRSRALGSRSVNNYGSPKNDFHPPPSNISSLITIKDLPHVLFFSSSRENEKTPEIYIETRGEIKPRGALSWAFAKALRGAADMNGDTFLSRNEIVGYINTNVITISERRQHPCFLPNRSNDKPIFQVTPTDHAIPDLSTLSVDIIPACDAGKIIKKLKGVTRAGTDDTPDLVWDRTKSQVINGLGDIVTMECGPSIEHFQKIVDKWRILGVIRQLSDRAGLKLRFGAGKREDDRRYHKDDDLSFFLEGRRYEYFTLFNLSSEGKVQLLYPLNNDTYTDPIKIPVRETIHLNFVVTPPFGAEHLIGLSTAAPLYELHELLAWDHITIDALAGKLKSAGQGRNCQAGVIGLYSAP